MTLEVLLDVEDEEIQPPSCPHGPMLLFRKQNDEKFFACSACRSRKDCPAFLPFEEFMRHGEKTSRRPRSPEPISFEKFSSAAESNRAYCRKCHEAFLCSESGKHSGHDIVRVSDQMMSSPTQFLRPMDNDKREAQYFFSDTSVNYLMETLKSIDLNKIVCIGTPRLHEHLLGLKWTSMLLDFDKSLQTFFEPGTFCRYNMFNHHFFNARDEKKFRKFLKEAPNEKICLVTDPPFASRTEPIVQTLKKISRDYQKTNQSFTVLPIVWIFPYFMETYIRKVMPEMEMLDFRIEYTNHPTFNDKKSANRGGSPVRIFTNILPNLLTLVPSGEYRFCSLCNRVVSKSNLHCRKCGECPSKSGVTYKHCAICTICVKPSYKHCPNCARCTQVEGHNCVEYQKQINCWICGGKGHSERRCRIFGRRVQNHGDCLLCRGKGHNLRRCPKREKLLKNI